MVTMATAHPARGSATPSAAAAARKRQGGKVQEERRETREISSRLFNSLCLDGGVRGFSAFCKFTVIWSIFVLQLKK